MSLVKEYKGVKIYVSPTGEFYCDVNYNSDNYNSKTFLSTKLQSIERAIDNFEGGKIEEEVYYDINMYIPKITVLKTIRKVGNRIFFDDGTDTSLVSRSKLYHRSISEKLEFKELENIFDKMKENNENIKKIYEENRKLMTLSKSKIDSLHKVNVI